MAEGEAVQKPARTRDRALNILDRVFPFLCLPLMVVMFDIASFQRFQPATDKTFYTIFLPPILAVAVGLPRMLLTMGAKRGSSRWRRNTSQLFAVVIGIAVLVILGWKPHPGGLYVLSGALDRSEGKVVRLEVHDFINRETSYRGNVDHTDYAVVSFADRPAMRFEINLGDLNVPISHSDNHHDLQARWHPGVLGLSWIDRNSLQVLPDIYKLEFEDGDRRFRPIGQLRGKPIVLVGVGRCMPPGSRDVFRQLSDLTKSGAAVIVRCLTPLQITCEENQEVVADPWGFERENLPFVARHSTDRFLEHVLMKHGEHLDPLDAVVVNPDGRMILHQDLTKPAELKELMANVRQL